MQVEIDQGEVRAEPMMVLRDATIAHPVEAEDAFQDAEHMFYFRSYFRLGCVLSFRFFVDIVFELRPAAGHVLGVWRGLLDRLRLALIAAVAPHLALFAVQQVGQHVLVGHRGRGRADRMHHALLAVHPDMRLQTEYHWLPFLVWCISGSRS